VREAVGRGLRDLYKQHESEPPPHYMVAWLARLARSQDHNAAAPSDDDGRHAARIVALSMGVLFSLILALNALAS
jgi:hypothetical protein